MSDTRERPDLSYLRDALDRFIDEIDSELFDLGLSDTEAFHEVTGLMGARVAMLWLAHRNDIRRREGDTAYPGVGTTPSPQPPEYTITTHDPNEKDD